MEEIPDGTIHNMDCVTGMGMMQDGSVDLVVTDPPFAIDFQSKKANYNRTGSRVIDGYREITDANYYDFSARWMGQAFRVLKESGSMYVFSGWNHLKDVLCALDHAGFCTVNHLIWKYQFGVVTSRKFVTSHYHCIYVCKNDKERKFYPFARFGRDEKDGEGRSLHYRDKEDVWVINREYWNGSKKTPTKLPSEIIRKILAYSSRENDLVMDPFLGSGQVAVVSKQTGRRFVGFEVVPDYFAFAKERLDKNAYRIPGDHPAS